MTRARSPLRSRASSTRCAASRRPTARARASTTSSAAGRWPPTRRRRSRRSTSSATRSRATPSCVRGRTPCPRRGNAIPCGSTATSPPATSWSATAAWPPCSTSAPPASAIPRATSSSPSPSCRGRPRPLPRRAGRRRRHLVARARLGPVEGAHHARRPPRERLARRGARPTRHRADPRRPRAGPLTASQLRRPGRRRGAPADPLPVGRPRVLRVPAAGLHRALQLHRDRPPGHRRERQAARAVLDRGAMPSRSPGSSARSGSSRRTSPASRSAPRWACTGRPPPGPRALAVAAQRVGRQRRLPDASRRDVAHAGRVGADRRGRRDPGHLPARLHARAVRRARRPSTPSRTSSAAARPAARRVPGPDRRGDRARREGRPGRDRRPDADHRRRARPRLLDALRRADPERDRRQRAVGLVAGTDFG